MRKARQKFGEQLIGPARGIPARYDPVAGPKHSEERPADRNKAGGRSLPSVDVSMAKRHPLYDRYLGWLSYGS
jgi:hypothetical protein